MTSREITKFRERIRELIGEIMVLLAEVNETEKAVSRLKNELQEMYETCDNILDR